MLPATLGSKLGQDVSGLEADVSTLEVAQQGAAAVSAICSADEAVRKWVAGWMTNDDSKAGAASPSRGRGENRPKLTIRGMRVHNISAATGRRGTRLAGWRTQRLRSG
jgi:hypothetical protein